jgi:peroxiredoxin
MRILRFQAVTLMVCVGLLFVGQSGVQGAGNMPDELSVGAKAPHFTLTSTQGDKISLSGLLAAEETKAVVVQFISTRCPVSKAYDSRMVELHKQYHGKGVRFIGVNSNTFPDRNFEDLEEMKLHADKVGITYSVVKDKDSGVANMYGAMTTPHIYLLDATGHVRYVGAIDDSQNAGKVKKTYLMNALDELLEGKDVALSHTKSFGCSIKRNPKAMTVVQ